MSHLAGMSFVGVSHNIMSHTRRVSTQNPERFSDVLCLMSHHVFYLSQTKEHDTRLFPLLIGNRQCLN